VIAYELIDHVQGVRAWPLSGEAIRVEAGEAL